MAIDWRTPALSVIDGRGLPIRQVAYLRTFADEPASALISRQRHDIAGCLVTQWDPRLDEPNLTTVYGLGAAVLKSDSVDAGWRISLPGLAGEALEHWDECDNHWRTTFDDQLRVVAVEENAEPDVDTFTYADATADAGHNLRGQLLELKDRSGSLRTDSFALAGEPLKETRTFHDGEAFSSHRVFSPLGALLELTDAGGHQQRSRYGLAGQLRQVQLLVKGHTEWQSVLRDAQYNAADQIIEQQAGNLVLSRWTYDPANGRLHKQSSRKDSGDVLQDFEYFYDGVGNITRIEDHAFEPAYFANQLVDGHRDFAYDSLYRLIRATGYDDAPPSDIPGLPQPGNPDNRLNYTQTYEYDSGGNMTKLVHVRAGNNHTRQMRIDPLSNRGVRWQPGDPEPVFDTLFDRHGNLQALQPGQDMYWNVRDELSSVILVHRETGSDDAEHYRYSQGARVFKRHETFTAGAEHFHQVRYLPGLEIRTKDNGEELHVISVGNARCLHWIAKKPADIPADQLRYSLEDHLGSCAMELDPHAQLISHEGYYPFGATAWMVARSAIEVGYKFIRYSGKEMDVSGLYYYGARYYAPWLQRWSGADPAGDVDGLNLYGFVGNNPLRYFDDQGTTLEESAAKQKIIEHSNFLSATNSELKKLNYQLYNFTRTRDIYKTAGKKLLFSLVTFAITIKAGAIGATITGGAASVTGPAAPVLVPVAAAVGGIVAANAANTFMEKVGEETTLGYTITPDPSALSINRLKSKASAESFSLKTVAQSFNPDNSAGLTKTVIETTARTVGKHLKVPYAKQALTIARQSAHLTEALQGSFGEGDLNIIRANLDALEQHLMGEETTAQAAFEVMNSTTVKDQTLVGAMSMPMEGDLKQAQLQQELVVARGQIKHIRSLVDRVSAQIAQKQAA
ncbi:RHS repeat-associated core domain-containing protein [Pseudomonas mandelii]|uniref:RHS repeat-associated core domain-containing protein n=1 Tax=Pseudomonas mandelii TaxID=75612 RepID=UPI00209EEC4C|nr:RHS repeat-associated core domain-containing protein [Pseudomonas mandelii]MCO8312373.1 toxin [Pseudomonas mandelii]